ncbi:MAG: Hsp70 family protein [Deltaproteobacteria bacterium]|nr:Hsp70 family protein [Deltaproteobacteria bacterium]
MNPSQPAPGSLVLGIDFGTTYSRAAAVIQGKIQLVSDSGEASMPSVVYFPKQGEPVVGWEALRYLPTEPSVTISSIKRLLGRNMSESEVRVLNYGVGYAIKPGPGNMAVLRIHDADYAPAQIAAAIITKLRKMAERRFGGVIRHAVMTVPAEASGDYLLALKRAASLAQLEVIQFIAEPVAGALAFGMHKAPTNRRIAVCDFGGGTFDASLVEQQGMNFRAVGYGGDSFLGGDDFDSALAEAVAGVVFGKSQVDLHRDAIRWRELLLRCESVKRQLSGKDEARLRMTEAYFASGTLNDLDLKVERKWIEPRWQPLVERGLGITEELLTSSSWDATSVQEIVLIGGTTLMPLVRQGFTKLFNRHVKTSERADVAVAVGAALQAAAYSAQAAAQK